MNIVDLIRQETSELRRHTAVVDGDLRLSYGELLDAAGRLAEELARRGVERFHRVGLLCEDSADYIVCSLAILSLSAAVVPISPEQADDEIEAIIRGIDLDVVLAESRYRPDGDQLPTGLFSARSFTLTRRQANRAPEGYYGVNPAFIRFTSGTTGSSKGVVLSHEAIAERTDAADKGLHITADDTVLWVLSMSFHFVVTILLFLRRGATIVLCGRNIPHSLVEGICRHNGTFIYASPFHYALLARSGDLADDALAGVRMAVSTAMKLPKETAEQFAARFGMPLTEAYGIIEIGLPIIWERESVGRVLPDFQLQIVEPDGDGVGEIRLKGKGMLDAYYSPWRGRQEIMPDGWFATGDLGRVDADGFVHLAGRKKEVIIFAGMKVFPQEVEEVINRFPGVRDSQVYPVPHPGFGELPVARVVLADGMDGPAIEDELQRFCYGHLSRYKVPKDFIFVDSLPKTASGKTRR